MVDVEELGTHGGSLRVHARPAEAAGEPSARVKAVLDAEEAVGLHTVAGHEGFAGEVLRIKSDLLTLPDRRRSARARSVAGYGAPGKGNTLLNHCGIRSDLLQYTVDRSPVKQGKFLPGTHIPIYAPRSPRRDKAGLHPRPAVEPSRGDQRAAWPMSGPGAGGWSSRFRRSKSSERTAAYFRCDGS